MDRERYYRGAENAISVVNYEEAEKRSHVGSRNCPPAAKSYRRVLKKNTGGVESKGYMKLRTAKREEGAQLVSEDRLTDAQIAEKIGISRQQLTRWKANKAFAARVEELTAIWTE